MNQEIIIPICNGDSQLLHSCLQNNNKIVLQ